LENNKERKLIKIATAGFGHDWQKVNPESGALLYDTNLETTDKDWKAN